MGSWGTNHDILAVDRLEGGGLSAFLLVDDEEDLAIELVSPWRLSRRWAISVSACASLSSMSCW